MKKQLLSAGMLCALGLMGCGGGMTTPGNTDTGPKYNTADKISTYLEGKTLLMTGANIPDYPNGYNEDVNYGPVTQCYVDTTISVASGLYYVKSRAATLRDASKTDADNCDHTKQSGTTASEFHTTTPPIIENVRQDGSCFDVTFNYGSFGQEGRGQVSQDGKTVKMELFFLTQATGIRCADGDVGSPTVVLKGTAFTHNAVQTYVVQ